MTTENSRPVDIRNSLQRKKGNGTYEKSALPFAQKLRIAHFLEAHKERLFRDRPRYKTTAEEVSKELGIHVSHHTLRNVAKATGIHWRQVQHRKNTGQGAKGHNWTRNSINLLLQQVDCLRNAICTLCSRVGMEDYPIDITRMWPMAEPEDLTDNSTTSK